MIAINQAWQRGIEYFTVERIDGVLAHLTGNAEFSNLNKYPSVDIGVKDLEMYFENEETIGYYLLR